ncbi:MAG: methionine synthase [Actinomycetota bacterium]
MSAGRDGGAFLINYPFKPHGLATAIGSFPYHDARKALDLIFKYIPGAPCWPQLPQRAPEEDMIAQFIEGLPGVVWIGKERRLFFNTEGPVFDEGIVHFYEKYLAFTDDNNADLLEEFAITQKHSAGFYAYQEKLWFTDDMEPIKYLKGHVTGPVTFGLGLPDQTGKASFYSEQLRDMIVKNLAMKARWQIDRLSEFGKKCIIFIDEPVLASFGSSAMISVSREQVVKSLTEVVEAIHAAEGIAGIHCCGNTDWSMVLETPADILSLDAYAYGESLFLYPDELRAFILRGGTIAWGMVPTSEQATTESAEALVFRYEGFLNQMATLGFSQETLRVATMFTPSCGTGSLSEDLTESVLATLSAVSHQFTGS